MKYRYYIQADYKILETKSKYIVHILGYLGNQVWKVPFYKVDQYIGGLIIKDNGWGDTRRKSEAQVIF